MTTPAQPRQICISRSERTSGDASPANSRAVRGFVWLLACCVAAGSLAGWSCEARAAPRTGEQIYKSLCASCHGAQGEGTKLQETPLLGDRSVLELARIIEKTMPEDDPTRCVGDDARLVAQYIHETFYSPTAQVRNRPARVELSRLTVRQYQQTLADLVASFRGPPPKLGDERGLRGEYFTGRRFNNQDRAIDRIDPQVKFDFGEGAPAEEKFQPDQFSIKWQGSVIAPETADYEFVVRTEHAARLWVNDTRTPLIDAWVKSGKDVEFRGTLRLLAGRAYPLRLEYSKAKQGVDDSKKNPKRTIAKSSIGLYWKLPHRELEPVPRRCLTPQGMPELFVVGAAFPPDDRSVGYERGNSISKAWEQATTDGAIETAAYVLARLDSLAGASPAGPDREKKLREFAAQFAAKAFRRPLSAEQKALYVDRQFDDAADPATAVKQCLLLALKSPRFLYRELQAGAGDPFDVASRLSYGLWDSAPDAELLRAAAAGQLADRGQLEKQAERMLGDLRARVKLRDFFLQWLKVDHYPDLAKDPKKFPEFTPEVVADLRTSLELFIDQVVWSEASDFRQLLLADRLPANERLAKFYSGSTTASTEKNDDKKIGAAGDAPTGAGASDEFRDLPLDARRTAGVLTHPYLLASLAYTDVSSPIHRGVLVSRSLLGRVLRPPPEAVAPLAPDLHASLTTRERVTLQTKAEACVTCHGMINPLGFTLEQFDAVGRFRAQENDKPIDASGQYRNRSGKLVKFSDVRDLAGFLASSEESHQAFISQLFHHLIKQPIRAYGPDRLGQLQKTLWRNDFSVRKLAVEIVVGAALPAP